MARLLINTMSDIDIMTNNALVMVGQSSTDRLEQMTHDILLRNASSSKTIDRAVIDSSVEIIINVLLSDLGDDERYRMELVINKAIVSYRDTLSNNNIADTPTIMKKISSEYIVLEH